MYYEEAYSQIAPVIAALHPACDFISTAGSIRRRKSVVKDAEIVIAPATMLTANLFDIPTPADERAVTLDNVLQDLIKAGTIAYDPFRKCNGPKMKRFKVLTPEWHTSHPDGNLDSSHSADSAALLTLELYIATAMNLGPILLIRTGNADFARLCVTSYAIGGLMPYGKRQYEGHLQNLAQHESQYFWINIFCPNEEQYFHHLGIEPKHIPLPKDRNMEAIIRLRTIIRDRNIKQEADGGTD